ncbi:MAG: ribonuclease P protein component [Mycobacteriaceae bacterium]|nr:ribonuclease P protein component [Mycobacteriaceae bacterium]
MLSAHNRMRRSTEFEATVKYGIRATQPDLVVHLLRGRTTGGPRVGLVVSKKVGSAVERHRVSRRLRHVVRAVLRELEPADQVVIRALPGSRRTSSRSLQHQLSKGLRRAFDLVGTQR